MTTPQIRRAAPKAASSVRSRSSRAGRAEPARATPLPTPSEPTQEPVATASASGEPIGGEYTVERNDTLWRIASRVTPGGSRREINQHDDRAVPREPGCVQRQHQSPARRQRAAHSGARRTSKRSRPARRPRKSRARPRSGAARSRPTGRTGRSEPPAAGHAGRNARCAVVGDACAASRSRQAPSTARRLQARRRQTIA